VSFGLVEDVAKLNGHSVPRIHADLSGGDALDLTAAFPLKSNFGTSFIGTQKGGSFEIEGRLARQWLRQPNVNSRSNADVVRPWANGQDLTGRPSGQWVVDFGNAMEELTASMYEAAFAHVVAHVKPERMRNQDVASERYWWMHQRARPELRVRLANLPRYLATPRVAKHRYFVWLDIAVLPDSRLCVIARADDATFGLLGSRMHEVWSLAQASMHGVGNDPTYNAKSCFETFPFPEGLTPADTAHQLTEAIDGGALIPAGLAGDLLPVAPTTAKALKKPKAASAKAGQALAAEPVVSLREHAARIARAAHRLNQLRENWLNPPEWTQRIPEVIPSGMNVSPYPDRIVPKNGHEKDLAGRTLTRLYNQRPAWLDAAHQALDAAVAAAYGWTDYTADLPDEEILKRLLALNLARQSGSS
jgi:hypothetical protein